MKNSAYKIFKDNRTAHEVFAGFKDDRLPFLLESSQDVCGMGRYSFLGSDPFLVFSVKRDKSGSALAILRELFRDHCLEGEKKASIPFLCGAVGFLSYDLCFSLESLGGPPNQEHSGIAKALSWFLPQHYSVALVKEEGLPSFFDL